MIKYIDSEQNFENEILKQNELVLVDFFATWCGPCNMLSPILEKISNENDKIKIFKVDIDKFSSLAINYEIEFVPTILIFKNGKELNRLNGLVDDKEILDFIKNY